MKVMIDEKKIEEAAEKYSGRYFGLPRELRCGERCFKAGINWFKENLWHDASEEPKDRSKDRLHIRISKNGNKTFISLPLNPSEIPVKWDDIVAKFRFTHWLYIEDLMKGGKK